MAQSLNIAANNFAVTVGGNFGVTALQKLIFDSGKSIG